MGPLNVERLRFNDYVCLSQRLHQALVATNSPSDFIGIDLRQGL